MNNFMISERDLGLESDNLLNYYAGPIKIAISGFDETITLSTNKYWKKLLPECLEMCEKAWNLDKKNIDIKELEVIIKYNFENLKLFIEYSIIFL